VSPLDVSKAATFDRISGLLDELAGGLFPDGFVHLGGDEVNTACWESTPAVAAWLEARNLTADGGYAHFVKTVADLAIAKKRRPVQWSEVWDHFKTDLPRDVVVHVWKSVTNVTDVVAAGYDVIRNVGYDATSWYLDNLNVNSSAVYGNEPCDGIPADLCAAHVLGGHGEM
jgi:hexosaminidase